MPRGRHLKIEHRWREESVCVALDVCLASKDRKGARRVNVDAMAKAGANRDRDGQRNGHAGFRFGFLMPDPISRARKG
jgi:hypothetical protein